MSLSRKWHRVNQGGIQLAWPSDHNSIYVNGGLSSRVDRHWYRSLCNFSEVESQCNVLQTWIAGEAARIVDQLDDEEVRRYVRFLRPIMVGILKVSRNPLVNSDHYKSNACSLVLKRIKFPKNLRSVRTYVLKPKWSL